MTNKLTYHLLPTEEASFLEMYDTLSVCQFDNTPLKSHSGKNQHLYLTSSDEEIKEGDWFIMDNNMNNPQVVQRKSKTLIVPKNDKKILFTTDPKLWDIRMTDVILGKTENFGVGKIDGNTKAKIVTEFSSSYTEEIVVNFLTEFCNRYNQKDNQKVDVDGLANEYYDKIDERISEHFRDRELILSNGRKGFIEGYNQALQSIGPFSLQQVELAIQQAFLLGDDQNRDIERIKDMVVCNIQSLTPHSKGEMVIEVEMEEVKHQLSLNSAKHPISHFQIKLTNGQPILIFK